ncbi:bifunctional diguanylate cyclase/phosphodiesterase [Rheinheimera sp.]|uniref:putative bifunctional diguanylate cyclase/phosphodiesterase n=1 Tax=Rheinheimera sp. TaxID=1869214 RepID=UPI002735428D|nr:EAL domain-containing protein [Rheinheimera sp.]MDP2716545.1 EAL domain-containing protein [Rheinheimera sp.]
MPEQYFSAHDTEDFQQQISHFRIRRLLQITGFTLFGLILAMAVASGTTKLLILAGCIALLLAGGFALKQQALISAYILLWSMALMLSALAYVSGGLRDLALLGFPGLLVYAAILGSVGLFYSLLLFVMAFCSLVTALTLSGQLHPVIPALGWQHLLFVAVILAVTGFSVYLMVRDMRLLMLSLQQENDKVRHSRKEIERLAHHDPLTGLPNRISGEQLYNQLLQHCREQQQQLAVLFLDLDNFKPVNDSLGHSAGDILLRQLAGRLQQALNTEQKVVRFGGDEFLFLVPTDADKQQLSQLAVQLITEVTKPFSIMQTDVSVSGSIGIAIAPGDGSEFNVLCRKADLAMYKAKEDGRNTFRFYDDKLDQDNVDKFNLLQRLRLAIKEHGFELHYQPKVDLRSGCISSVEALLRWPQSDGSMISPAEFIPLAEQSGLISELGNWVIAEACQAAARLRAQGFSELRMAVNLSYVQFKNTGLEHTVQQALRRAGLPAAALELELTESLLIGDTDFIQHQLNALSQLGVTFAIDDFGTGYSNLSYLRSFNATTLKIDRSFIASLCVSERDEPLVQAIINMAASLGLKTVAEGIEDAATLQRLQALGCDEGQGFYWSAAVAETAVIPLLNRHNQTINK